MATSSSILAWEIPCTEEPGGLQTIGSERVERDLVTKQQQFFVTWVRLRLRAVLLCYSSVLGLHLLSLSPLLSKLLTNFNQLSWSQVISCST